MATGNIQANDSATNIANLLNLFRGKSGSSTQSTNISAQGLQALIQQQLQGTQGLAAISGGQKSAGLYNSSTRQLLTNDLLTRSAGEAASRSSSTSRVDRSNPALSGKDLLTILALDQAKKRAGPALQSLGDYLGFGSDAGATTVGSALTDPLIPEAAGSYDFGAGDLIANLAGSSATDAATDTAAEEGGAALGDYFSSFFGG